MLPNPGLVDQFSATPQCQLNWTGPIANGSKFDSDMILQCVRGMELQLTVGREPGLGCLRRGGLR